MQTILPIPNRTGIGLRFPHYQTVMQQLPPIPWWEVHSENFFAEGGVSLVILETIRQHYPISLHGIGLSLGSAEGVDKAHLQLLRQLARRIEPALISEHISWSSGDGIFLPDLLPLPYTEEALMHLVREITKVQEVLGVHISVENPSSYVQFADSSIPEWEFMAEVAKRSGCGLLLDINNIVVSCANHAWDAERYMQAIPPASVTEYHLAGHAVMMVAGERLRLDDHGSAVPEEVWQLYDAALAHIGPRPTLIERDNAIPPLAVLMDEAERADRMMAGYSAQIEAA